MWLASIVCLMILIACCVAGTFVHERWYDDNLLQRVGMGCVAVGFTPRLLLLIEAGNYDTSALAPWSVFAIHFGLACYALGTVVKVLRHGPREESKPPPERASWLPKG